MRRIAVPLALTLVSSVALTACGTATTAPTPDPATATTSTLRPGTVRPSTPGHAISPSTPSTPRPKATPGRSTGDTMRVVAHGLRDRREIALTFDADLTAAMRRRLDNGKVRSYYNATLIAELRQLHVPATLFLTGMWMERYPQQTRALAADPLFELGTHTYTHRGFTRHCYGLGSVPPAEMLADVTRATTILARLDPHPTAWFRFPGGCYDATALRRLAPAGLTAVQFDDVGADGFADRSGPIVDRVVRGARNGSIVVLHMHGGDNAPRTAEAVPVIVRRLRAKGYRFVTVSRLLG